MTQNLLIKVSRHSQRKTSCFWLSDGQDGDVGDRRSSAAPSEET